MYQKREGIAPLIIIFIAVLVSAVGFGGYKALTRPANFSPEVLRDVTGKESAERDELPRLELSPPNQLPPPPTSPAATAPAPISTSISTKKYSPQAPAVVSQEKLIAPPQPVTLAPTEKGSSSYPPPPLPSIPPNALSQAFSAGRCEGKGPVALTSPPIKMADTIYILPMGLMSGSHVTPVDHLYFHTSHKSVGRYDVLAPADGFVVSAEKVGDSQDYRFIIEHTCTFYSIYIHVTEVAPKILSMMNPPSQRSWAMRVPVRAGEVIGTKVPDMQAKTFQVDFSVANADVTLKGFITPGYYKGEPWKIHTDDIYGYYQEPLRSELVNKTVRTAPPISGKIDYDIDGRLVGNWFRAGTNGYSGSNPYQYWEGHLAIAYDYIDPTKIRISIGNWEGKSERGAVTGNMPDPKDVSIETGLVKYELIDSHYIHANGQSWDEETFANDIKLDISKPYLIGTLLVQLIDKRALKLETFPGKSASQVSGFTANAIMYER